MVEEGSWGLLFPKNRVYRVISFESVKYMLTTADDGEVFTLKGGEGGEEEEEEEEEKEFEPVFIGNWNGEKKELTDASGETHDWSACTM